MSVSSTPSSMQAQPRPVSRTGRVARATGGVATTLVAGATELATVVGGVNLYTAIREALTNRGTTSVLKTLAGVARKNPGVALTTVTAIAASVILENMSGGMLRKAFSSNKPTN